MFLLRSLSLLPIFVTAALCPAELLPRIEKRVTKIEKIAASIGIHEGWNVPGSLVRRQHNPGALVFARQDGAHRSKNAYAYFESDEKGKAALLADLRAKFSRGMTLGQIMKLWSEKSYGKQVARETGVAENEVVDVALESPARSILFEDASLRSSEGQYQSR